MAKNTLDMLNKILSEDDKTAAAQKKRMDKGEGGGYISPSVGDYRERLEIKKADVGGMIICWYGPNGSREVVVKDASEAVPVIEKFFSGNDTDSDEE